MTQFNQQVSFIVHIGQVATIYLRPQHTLQDILDCKKYIRQVYKNPKMIFRPSVRIHQYEI